MYQINDPVYYNSNSNNDNDDDDDDEDNGGTFHDAIRLENVIEDINDDGTTIYGEPVNNEFLKLVKQEDGAIGVTIKHEGVLYAQYCYYGNFTTNYARSMVIILLKLKKL